MLESLGQVYRVDAQAKALALSSEQRLAHHQTHSQLVMDNLLLRQACGRRKFASGRGRKSLRRAARGRAASVSPWPAVERPGRCQAGGRLLGERG